MENYNIAFGSPLTDFCSTCLQFKEQLKLTISYEKKSQLTTKNRVHLMKAEAFFLLLKYPKPNTVKFSFLTARRTWSCLDYQTKLHI
nr:unnamed protein product [Callosobruchus chinensis]